MSGPEDRRQGGRVTNDLHPDLFQPDGTPVLLSKDEHRAVQMADELWDHLATWVVDRGPSCSADLAELAGHIHAIQRAVLANAAARAHPDLYRVLGSTIEGTRP